MTFRPAATLFTLALAGCTGSLSSAPSSVPTEATDAPEPAGPVLHSPSSPAQLAALPWRSAWPAGEGVVADTDAAGRLLTPEESVAVSPGAQCGSLHHFPAQGKLWVPAGDPIAYEKAPAVSAALVERSAAMKHEPKRGTGELLGNLQGDFLTACLLGDDILKQNSHCIVIGFERDGRVAMMHIHMFVKRKKHRASGLRDG